MFSTWIGARRLWRAASIFGLVLAPLALSPQTSGAQEAPTAAMVAACKAHDGKACFTLGTAWLQGRPNLMRARLAFLDGCAAGNRDSCYNVATMYETGDGAAKDKNQALTYYQMGCKLGDADSCKRAQALSPPPLPSDPINPALIPTIESFLTLPLMADAMTYVPGTMQVTELVHYPNNPSYQRATVYFQAIQKWDGKQVRKGRNIEVRGGQPYCVLRESGGVNREVYYSCTPVYESTSVAKIAGDQELRNHMPADQRAAAMLAARNRHEPGSEITEADKACLKERYETFTTSEQGECLRSYATKSGGGGCLEYGTRTVPHTITHVKNVCRTPLNFNDMCGNSYFGEHHLKPGEEFIRKFDSPCYFAY